MRIMDKDEFLKKNKPRGLSDELWKECDEYKRIDTFPEIRSEQIQPNRKCGKWLYNKNYAYAWECSECGKNPTYRKNMAAQYVQPEDELFDYCPNCGAYMKEEKK